MVKEKHFPEAGVFDVSELFFKIKSQPFHRRYLMEQLLHGVTNVNPSNTDYILKNKSFHQIPSIYLFSLSINNK